MLFSLSGNDSIVAAASTCRLDEETRINEFYVPRFGPKRFRLLVGLSFYPYTLMNASYVLIGSLIAYPLHYDRMLELALVYLMAVGVSAHSLDALAPNRPWGAFLSRRQLALMAAGGLVPSLALGLYLALSGAPLLIPLGILEVFFLVCYNLELFSGRFHTDIWFAFSWGFLPVLAGFTVQTNSVGWASIAAGLFGFATAFVEISASRPYKTLKRGPGAEAQKLAARLEAILKGIVATVLLAAAFLFLRSAVG